MSKKKTDLPLDVLIAIQQVHSAIKERIGKDPLFRIEIFDQDNFVVYHASSTFSFQINIIKNKQTHKLDFHITRSPYSDSVVEEKASVSPNVANSIENFDIWLDLVRKYETVGILPMDPIWKYTLEFSQMYEIVDEDAEFEPFEYQRQIAIDKFLSETIGFLEEENSDSKFNEAISEAKSIKNDLGKLTKKQAIYRISHLLGQIRKQSVPLIAKFLDSKAGKLLSFIVKEVSKELIKEAIKGQL